MTFRACFRALTPLRPSPLKVLPVAADALTEPDIVKGDHPRSASLTGGEARLGGQRMHKSRDGRGENEGKGAFLLRKGFQRESFTLVERTREGTREGRHAAAVSPPRPERTGAAPIMHFRIRRFAGSTTFRSRIDSTSEEFEHDDNDDERKEK